MNDADDTPEARLLASIFGKHGDADEPPPAWLSIRPAAPLGDDEPDDVTDDDG